MGLRRKLYAELLQWKETSQGKSRLPHFYGKKGVSVVIYRGKDRNVLYSLDSMQGEENVRLRY